MVDGSLKFDTKFDTDGVNKATDMVNKSVSRMYQRVKQAFSGKEVDQSSAKMKRLQNNVDEANAKVEKQIAEVERLRTEYENLKSDDGYIEPEAAKPLIEQAETLKAKIAEAKQQVAEYDKQWEHGVTGADGKSGEWVDKVHSLQAEYDKVLEKIEKIESKAEAKHQTDRSAQLASSEAAIVDAEKKLGGLKSKADIAKTKLREALDAKAPAGFKKGLTGATAGLDKFVKRIGGLAKRVFIFTVITKALRKLKELLTSMTSSDKQIQTSLANIKGNLLTAFQPIYEFALPAIKALLHALEQASAFLASFTAALFGKSVSQMQKNAKALNKQATATSKVGKAAEKASRSLASFDELNQLSDNSSSSSGGTDASSAPSFDSNIANMETNVKKITAYATILAGIALVMVGIATANISAALFGVGLIITGIAFGKGSGAFSGIPQWVHQIITWGSMILGVVLIVLGCYLGFNPKLILAGLTMLGVGLAYGSASGAFDVAFAKISEFKDNVINKIKEFGANVKDWWISNLAKFFTREYWQEKFNNIRGKCADFKNAVFNGAQNLVSRIASSASNLWNKITSGAARMWDTVKNAGRDRLNGIISLVERCINTVVNKANRISWNIPDWVPGIGGKKFGFNLPTVSIPRLATGTVVPRNYGEYTAILGDNKREPEVVSPLSTMKQAVREVMNELSGDNSRPISISIYTTLDGKVVGQSVIEYHNGVVRRTGKTPLAGVSV
jgi:ABC-type cobalt transport system substrate-binding protein